ncbi:hypothetical protein ACLOJK_012635 [Asimina triloba]
MKLPLCRPRTPCPSWPSPAGLAVMTQNPLAVRHSLLNSVKDGIVPDFEAVGGAAALDQAWDWVAFLEILDAFELFDFNGPCGGRIMKFFSSWKVGVGCCRWKDAEGGPLVMGRTLVMGVDGAWCCLGVMQRVMGRDHQIVAGSEMAHVMGVGCSGPLLRWIGWSLNRTAGGGIVRAAARQPGSMVGLGGPCYCGMVPTDGDGWVRQWGPFGRVMGGGMRRRTMLAWSRASGFAGRKGCWPSLDCAPSVLSGWIGEDDDGAPYWCSVLRRCTVHGVLADVDFVILGFK